MAAEGWQCTLDAPAGIGVGRLKREEGEGKCELPFMTKATKAPEYPAGQQRFILTGVYAKNEGKHKGGNI